MPPITRLVQLHASARHQLLNSAPHPHPRQPAQPVAKPAKGRKRKEPQPDSPQPTPPTAVFLTESLAAVAAAGVEEGRYGEEDASLLALGGVLQPAYVLQWLDVVAQEEIHHGSLCWGRTADGAGEGGAGEGGRRDDYEQAVAAITGEERAHLMVGGLTLPSLC